MTDDFKLSVIKPSGLKVLTPQDYKKDFTKKTNKSKLLDFIGSENICEFLADNELAAISEICLKDLLEDEISMKDWLFYADKAMELTKLHREVKHTPWRNAANIKYPLISTAVVQFSSRAGAEMEKQGKVAKYKVQGRDNGQIDMKTGQLIRSPGYKNRKGQRIATHLNYQILEKIPHWRKERNKLNQQLAVVGAGFIKTYFDVVEGVIRSELIPYDCLIVNNGIEDLHEAPCISHYVQFTDRRIIEHQRAGLFRDDIDISTLTKDLDDPRAIYHQLVEQHRFLIFDDIDGFYPIPVIVTFHKGSGDIFRIVTRFEESDVQYDKKSRIKKIYPTQYFTDYTFIPDMSGGFFGIGFGTLLLDSNATVNTILNTMINAGFASTVQGGFLGKDLRVQKEDLEIDPTDWITVDSSPGAVLKDNIVPFNYKEPSQVLLSLLQFIIESCKQLTSTSDVMTGQTETQNVSPNTVQQLIGEGYKVYGYILRSIFGGYKRELQKIIQLNAKYVNVQEYLKLIDPMTDELKEMFDQYGQFTDYDLEDLDIVPIVDVNESTQVETVARAQAEMQIGAQILQLTPNAPAINPRTLARNIYTALETPNVEQLVSPEPDPNAPNPAMIKMQHDMDMDKQKNQIEMAKVQIKGAEGEALGQERQAKSVKLYSDAAADHSRLNLEKAQTYLEHKGNITQAAIDLHGINTGLKQTQIQADAKAQAAGGTGGSPPADQPDQTMDNSQGGNGGVPQSQTDNTMSPKGSKGKVNPNHLVSLARHHSPAQVLTEAHARGWKPKAAKKTPKGKVNTTHLVSLARSHSPKQVMQEAQNRGWPPK